MKYHHSREAVGPVQGWRRLKRGFYPNVSFQALVLWNLQYLLLYVLHCISDAPGEDTVPTLA
jgi:hypothetical protein